MELNLLQRLAETIFFYYFIQIAFYIYHRLLHMPISGPLYRAHHVQHHKVCFPLKRLRALAYGLPPTPNSCLSQRKSCDAASTEELSEGAGPCAVAGNEMMNGGEKVVGNRPSSHKRSGNKQPISPSTSLNTATTAATATATTAAAGAVTKEEEEEHSDGWFKSGGELLFGIPMAMVGWLVLHYLPTPTALVFIGVMLFVAVWGDVMHSSFHLYDDAKSHPESLALHKGLVRTGWFRHYQHLHDIHHAHTNKNFGFFDFTIDKLFGTFCEVRPAFLPVPPARSVD